MRPIRFVFFLVILMLWLGSDRCLSGVDIGLSIGDDGIKGFYLAVGEHFKVPEKEIVIVQKNIPDEDMPVVFFLARNASVSSEAIIKLRLRGKSWMEITTHFGLSPELFYVPVKKKPGPPYGKAYGHFKNKKKADWKKIQLPDADIVNLVNLKFISEHYGYPPEDVITMRHKGKSFIDINTEVKKDKKRAKKKSSQLAASEESAKKVKGKGKSGKK